MQRLGLWRLAAVLLGALQLQCGYRMLRSDAPFGASRIAVMPFVEQQPIGLTAELSHNLLQRLAQGGVDVVTDSRRAQAILTGTLSLYTVPGATLQAVQLYNVDAVVHAELIDTQGQILWQQDVTVRESFLPPDPGQAPQPLTIESRRRVALARLAERAAHALHDALVVAGSATRSN